MTVCGDTDTKCGVATELIVNFSDSPQHNDRTLYNLADLSRDPL